MVQVLHNFWAEVGKLVSLDLLELDDVLEPQFFFAQLFANWAVKGFWALCTTIDETEKPFPKSLDDVF